MLNRFLLILTTFSIIILALIHQSKDQPICRSIYSESVTPISLVYDPLAVSKGITPIEQRGVEYRKWLAKGVRILAQNTTGSGTIIYYDKNTGWAYVQSCGHLWRGNMSARGKSKTAQVVTWYHNNVKLNRRRTYTAEVLMHSNHSNPDISLLRFKPDWIPEFFPIAPHNYVVQMGVRAHSIGCDGGREIAHYDVKIVRYDRGSWTDLVTIDNSPRSGRSGGGLISNDGYYIGICWGTSHKDGSGNGYFTPLSDIHKIMKREGFEWLLNISTTSLVKELPIIDRNNPQKIYSKNYIAIPK